LDEVDQPYRVVGGPSASWVARLLA